MCYQLLEILIKIFQEILYNNNESESGLNEQIQQSGLLESNNGLSRVFEENGNQEARKYTRTEFEQWEKSIKPITESKLTNGQRRNLGSNNELSGIYKEHLQKVVVPYFILI